MLQDHLHIAEAGLCKTVQSCLFFPLKRWCPGSSLKSDTEQHPVEMQPWCLTVQMGQILFLQLAATCVNISYMWTDES